MSGKDVETRQAPVQPEPYNPALHTAEDLWSAGTHEVQGYDLVSGKDNMDLMRALVGVPFVIVRMVFRKGDYTREKDGIKTVMDYVTVEAVIAPLDRLTPRLKFAHKTLDELPFGPEQHIVINDGSTGIRRQCTEYLSKVEYIGLPDGPVNGAIGDSIYDTPQEEWQFFGGDVRFGANDGTQVSTFDVRLACPRGLRESEYTNEYTQDGHTFYLG